MSRGTVIPTHSSQLMKEINMTSNNIYHYTYRISNTIEHKHYYGRRSSKIEPKMDLGYKYFSSSRDLNFIKDQKENPQNYKYKIVAIYDCLEKALALEVKLHRKFNVGKNPAFYNRACQTATRYTATNMSIERRKILSERWKGELNPNNYISNKGENNPMFGSARFGELNPFYGKKHSEETLLRMRNVKLGKTYSEETKRKLSAMRKGVPKKRGICPYCGIEMTANRLNLQHIPKCNSNRPI